MTKKYSRRHFSSRPWLLLGLLPSVLFAATTDALAAVPLAQKFWREHSDSETSRLLDDLVNSSDGCAGIVPQCEHAIVALQKLLDSAGSINKLQPNETPEVIQVWWFLGAILESVAENYSDAGEHDRAIPPLQRCLAIYNEVLGPDRPESVGCLDRLASLYKLTGRYAEALPLYQRSVEIHIEGLGPEHRDVARVLNGLATIYQAMGRYAEGLPLLQHSLAIVERTSRPDDQEDVAAILNNLATSYEAMGQYADALPLYQRGLAIAEAAVGPEDPLVAKLLNNLAGLYSRMGQYPDALNLYQRSLTTLQKNPGKHSSEIAAILNSFGTLYGYMGRYADASAMYKRSQAALQQSVGSQHPNFAVSLASEAAMHCLTGHYAEALSLYERSFEILRKTLDPSHPLIAENFDGQAILFKSIGQYGRSLELFHHSLTIREKMQGSEHPDVATNLDYQAELYTRVGQYSAALPLYQRSLAIRTKAFGAEHPSIVASLSNMALNYDEMGLYAEALPLHQRSLAIRTKILGSEDPSSAAVLSNLGLHYKRLRRYSDALPLYVHALQLAVQSKSAEATWTIEGNLSGLYAKRIQPALAAFWGKRAVNTIQSMRSGLVSLDRDLQRSFLQDKGDPYRQLGDVLIDQNRLQEAQQVLALLKEEEQFDYLQRNPDKDPRRKALVYTSFERPWVERYERESAGLGKVGAEHQALIGINEQIRTPEQTNRLMAVNVQLSSAQKKYENFIEELSVAFSQEQKQSVDFNAADGEQLAGLQRQLASLGHGAVAIQYLVMEERVRILVTTPRGIVHRDSDVTEKDLNASIDRYRKVLENPMLDPFKEAQGLYAHLLKPIEADLENAGAKILMVSLDGRTRYLPIAALHDGKQWVAERYAIAIYTPVTRSNLRAQPRARWQVAGFGVSDGAEGVNPLTYVSGELEEIIRTSDKDKDGVVGGSIYLNEKAREDVLERAIQQQLYPVLHIASHFYFTPGGTLADSYLLLGQGKRLTLEQFSSPRFAMKGVDLLVLSACQTAMEGTTQDGREIEGFGNLAQAQGAQAVLATQWSVNDESTALLMREFYAQRESKQLTKAEALQNAQLSLLHGPAAAVLASGERSRTGRGTPIRPNGVSARATFTPSEAAPYAHPYYWAPFILMGNWL